MADRIGGLRENFDPFGRSSHCRTMVRSPAASYDVPVGGIDEVSARSVLTAMQDRLARDPASSLGLMAGATADEVRAAFLHLTKQYHPVRFGRMALDIQKLSNEVFLALRAAHDTLAKVARRQSGQIPAVSIATGRVPTPSATQLSSQPPVPAPPSSSARITQQIPVKPARSPSSSDSGERPPVPPRTMTPATGDTSVPSRSSGQLAIRSPNPVPAPVRQTGVHPAVAPPPQAPVRQTGAYPVVAPPPQAPVRQTGAYPAVAPPPQAPVRQTGAYPVVAPPAMTPLVVTPRDEAVAVDLLQRQQWEQARSVLHQLSASDPSSKRIRALMSYARGREAQLGRRLDDARVELQDALELDPDLQLAKTALTQLFTRRK